MIWILFSNITAHQHLYLAEVLRYSNICTLKFEITIYYFSHYAQLIFQDV